MIYIGQLQNQDTLCSICPDLPRQKILPKTSATKNVHNIAIPGTLDVNLSFCVVRFAEVAEAEVVEGDQGNTEIF